MTAKRGMTFSSMVLWKLGSLQWLYCWG